MSMTEFKVNPSLVVHCFWRDSAEAGPGPLFVLREWDLKVIRTIGHKPKCKGPNHEQALRACVRQGLLSLNLKTENASKEEIQLLKAKNVLGKRAPSGSVIGAPDLIRLLEYFSKNDIAGDLRTALLSGEHKHLVSTEIINAVISMNKGDVKTPKFKINTEDSSDNASSPPLSSTNSSADRRDDRKKDKDSRKKRERDRTQKDKKKTKKRQKKLGKFSASDSDSDSDTSRNAKSLLQVATAYSTPTTPALPIPQFQSTTSQQQSTLFPPNTSTSFQTTLFPTTPTYSPQIPGPRTLPFQNGPANSTQQNSGSNGLVSQIIASVTSPRALGHSTNSSFSPYLSSANVTSYSQSNMLSPHLLRNGSTNSLNTMVRNSSTNSLNTMVRTSSTNSISNLIRNSSTNSLGSFYRVPSSNSLSLFGITNPMMSKTSNASTNELLTLFTVMEAQNRSDLPHTPSSTHAGPSEYFPAPPTDFLLDADNEGDAGIHGVFHVEDDYNNLNGNHLNLMSTSGTNTNSNTTTTLLPSANSFLNLTALHQMNNSLLIPFLTSQPDDNDQGFSGLSGLSSANSSNRIATNGNESPSTANLSFI